MRGCEKVNKGEANTRTSSTPSLSLQPDLHHYTRLLISTGFQIVKRWPATVYLFLLQHLFMFFSLFLPSLLAEVPTLFSSALHWLYTGNLSPAPSPRQRPFRNSTSFIFPTSPWPRKAGQHNSPPYLAALFCTL